MLIGVATVWARKAPTSQRMANCEPETNPPKLLLTVPKRYTIIRLQPWRRRPCLEVRILPAVLGSSEDVPTWDFQLQP